MRTVSSPLGATITSEGVRFAVWAPKAQLVEVELRTPDGAVYHRLTREHLAGAGVADYLLVDSQGATEAAVRFEAAEAVSDITSTGETLRANGLKVLADGVIHRSEATLFRSRTAAWGEAEMEALGRLRRALGA